MVLGKHCKFLALGLAALATEVATGDTPPGATSSCRVLPGDTNWPTPQDWQDLNKTVGGRLTETVPRESVCHDAPYSHYDAVACAELQKTFDFPTLARWLTSGYYSMDVPGEFMDMSFKNYSCDPFAPRSEPCGLGNHASYVIEVRDAEDVKAALAFVGNHNIRLVVKNTGHDYLGRSTGTGALSLWTHHLKLTEFIPAYASSHYTGPAMKLGAGVQGFEAYAAANATGHRIVSGSCPTVGIAGGYSQGGGHSILSSCHGLGSDNVLEWEVVTVDGRHLVATPDNEHADLYWALSGGGPGNYAIVLSMTARVHRDGIIGGGTLAFNDSRVGNDAFWDAVGAFQELLPDFSDAGGNSFVYGLTSSSFNAWTVTMPGADAESAAALMEPFLDDLSRRDIDYEYRPHSSPNFLEHFDRALGPLPEGIIENSGFMASRMIPRAVLADPAANARVTAALRNISRLPDYSIACQSLRASGRADGEQPQPANAVLPAWRDAELLCLPKGAWDPRAAPSDMARRQAEAVSEVQAVLDAATGPGGGVYMNEVSYLLPDWKTAMYGANYERLLAVKRKYDPESVLYVLHGVGSDAWVEEVDKRLCRAVAS
ncbi:FAD-dependent isoamyl alcohol oxidase [Apiospora rasikravindrae]|uniref:FAD-dependent isoamyl alcohol oxidase n=1 Tax=Apiospora rasikravindrae TaxID=990691 RepID=A0ABR1RWY9_9PEZI